MAVETDDDLAGFFDPDEFGEPMVATIGLSSVEFNGIYTDGPVAEKPGTTDGWSGASIMGYQPRIIAPRAVLADLKQGDFITRDGTQYSVNNIEIKGSLLIIFLHDNW